jgi:sugar/nucleoside kinase (ribokinase family)
MKYFKAMNCFEMEILRLRSLRTAHFVARGFRPFSTENEHTGSFSGRSEPQNDTVSVAPSQPWNGLAAGDVFIKGFLHALMLGRNDILVVCLRSE